VAVFHDAILTLRTKLAADANGALAGDTDEFAGLRGHLPTLHFMSMLLFDPDAGVPKGDMPVAPLFVLEVNVDGAAGPFWAALEDRIGDDLRDLLRYCAAPRGQFDTMFKAITAPGSRMPIAPLLERESITPAASHIGYRGLSRDRILCHDKLFRAMVKKIPPCDANQPADQQLPADVLAAGPAAIHAWLREKLLPEFPYLDEPWKPGVSFDEASKDRYALGGLLAITLIGALLPWLVLASVLGLTGATVIALLVGVLCTFRLQDIGDLMTLAGKNASSQAWWIIAAALLIGAIIAAWGDVGVIISWLLFPVGALAASLLILLALLRQREKSEPVPADSLPDPLKVRELQGWEDLHIAGSDHMGSVVIIKPGLLRGFLIRFGMRALHLALHVTPSATAGYLGSMRTIHFAHWGIVADGKRLLFLSNFDGSWESYLDDFIEKAHAGLTLAWANCIGFPPAEYMTLNGASQGRKFKAWARCSMAPSRMWYAAYPNITVNQIWRQARIAQGLCARTLSGKTADDWVKDL
jgi:hypothetical protein